MFNQRHMLKRIVATSFLVCAPLAYGFDISSTVGIEATGYTSVQDQSGVFDRNTSASLELEFNSNIGSSSLTFIPFYRHDSHDEERRHGDVRELSLTFVSGNWEFLAGLSKVFWGVTESSHLVDIVNQTDFLEGFDGEDKLGQPMLRLSYAFEQSTLTGFILPGFRERKFLSADNPLALPFLVEDTALYQSGEEDERVDFALRFSGYHDIIDYGLSLFSGTSRDPLFLPGNRADTLVAFYPLITQIGADVQITKDAWLWKLEAIHRSFDDSANGADYTAVVGGFEYSFYGMKDGAFDLGLLAEYHHDSRDDPANVVFQNDLFLGTRLAFNDTQSTEFLGGVSVDLDDQSSSLRIEGNRRIIGDAKLSLEAQVFTDVDADNISFGFRNSDFVKIT